MTRLTRLCAIVAAAQLVFVSTTADAQQATQAGTEKVVVQQAPQVDKTAQDSASRTNTPAPLATRDGVALRMNTTSTETVAPAPQMTRSSASAMMVVGLAGMVAGAVIGDDAGTVLMLAGAGVGLLGLYNYMR